MTNCDLRPNVLAEARLIVALLGAIAVGCSAKERRPEAESDAAVPSARPPDGGNVDQSPRLEFLTMTIAGMCSEHLDCWESVTVRRPDQLVLEDKEGMIRFAIAESEFEHVDELARTKAFAQKVRDSLEGKDCFGLDVGISMQYQWTGIDVVDVPHVDNCALAPGVGEPQKILYDLDRYLKLGFRPFSPTSLPPEMRSGSAS